MDATDSKSNSRQRYVSALGGMSGIGPLLSSRWPIYLYLYLYVERSLGEGISGKSESSKFREKFTREDPL